MHSQSKYIPRGVFWIQLNIYNEAFFFAKIVNSQYKPPGSSQLEK